MFKRIVSLCMAVVLAASVSACGTGGKNESAGQQDLPSYSETEIGSNSGLKWPGGSRVNSKNQLVTLERGDGSNSEFAILNKDGKPEGNIKCSLQGMVSAFVLDVQDNIYALTTENKTGMQKLEIISPKGDTLNTIDLGLPSSSQQNPAPGIGYFDIAVGANGNIYLADSSKGIQVLDKNGQQLKKIGSKTYQSIDCDAEGNIIALSFDLGKRAIEKLEASAGKSVWSVELPVNSGMIRIGSDKIRYSKLDKSIYYMDSQGIVKYDSSGKLAGTLLDFRSFTILASGYEISDLCIDASGNIFATTLSGGANGMNMNISSGGQKKVITERNSSISSTDAGKQEDEGATADSEGKIDNVAGPGALAAGEVKYEIYRFSLQSGDSAAQKKKTITVSIPLSDRSLDMAAAKFQKANPEYKVEILAYPSQDDSDSEYETYIKNLNTQILSGKGPDIMSVAGLPFNNYASKKILANLSDLIAGDKTFDMSKYYSNIFDALKFNGSLYALPINFSFNVLMAHQGALDEEGLKIDDSKWSWSDFKSIADKITQADGSQKRSALPSVTPDELLGFVTGGSYSNYINSDNKKANFNSQGFIDLLKTVKDFSNLGDNSIKNDMVSVLEAASRGSLVFYPTNIIDYTMYGFMKSAYKNRLSLYSMPSADGSDEGMFSSGSVYAINKNSKYTKACWELLKMLLSDEIQGSEVQGGMAIKGRGTTGGFSVNKAAQQKKAQTAIDMSQKGTGKMMMKSGDSSMELGLAPMTQEDIDYINKLISRLKTYANFDSNIDKIVQDETKAFFNGEKSAEETANLIQDRAGTYLGE